MFFLHTVFLRPKPISVSSVEITVRIPLDDMENFTETFSSLLGMGNTCIEKTPSRRFFEALQSSPATISTVAVWVHRESLCYSKTYY